MCGKNRKSPCSVLNWRGFKPKSECSVKFFKLQNVWTSGPKKWVKSLMKSQKFMWGIKLMRILTNIWIGLKCCFGNIKILGSQRSKKELRKRIKLWKSGPTGRRTKRNCNQIQMFRNFCVFIIVGLCSLQLL